MPKRKYLTKFYDDVGELLNEEEAIYYVDKETGEEAIYVDKETDEVVYESDLSELDKELRNKIDEIDDLQSKSPGERGIFKKCLIDLKNIYETTLNDDNLYQDYLLYKVTDCLNNISKNHAPYFNFPLEDLGNLLEEQSVTDIPGKIDDFFNDLHKSVGAKDGTIKVINEERVNIKIINECTETAKGLEKDDTYHMATLISQYNKAKDIHHNRSFFTKVAQFFTGNKEKKALDKLEKAIRNSINIDKKDMDKAFKVSDLDKLETMLNNFRKKTVKSNEQPQNEIITTEHIEISGQELGEPNNSTNNFEKVTDEQQKEYENTMSV